MLAVALVAVSVGFSNLAASVGLGVAGVSRTMRLRVLVTFGLFEAAMPIIGLLIGNDLATSVAGKAHWIGAAVLVALGCYGIVSFTRRIIRTPRARQGPVPMVSGPVVSGPVVSGPAVSGPAGSGPVVSGRSGGRQEWIKVAVSAFALSLDNLIAGFALGSYQVNLVVGALVFGVVSVVMSLVGLEFGARLGGWAGDSGDMIGGIVLVGVGLAIGFGVLG